MQKIAKNSKKTAISLYFSYIFIKKGAKKTEISAKNADWAKIVGNIFF